jgi:SAM-dependent methyltransferase
VATDLDRPRPRRQLAPCPRDRTRSVARPAEPALGLYDRHILPHAIDLVMRAGQSDKDRAGTVGGARGEVLEIGIGSGLNLPFYTGEVTGVTGVDPSAGLLAKTRQRLGGLTFPVTLLEASAEELPFAAGHFDSAVCTWSLCSIPRADRALEELRRVLRPGGRLHFVEHGRSPEPGVQRWQTRLTPLWKPISGGCHLDRRIDVLVADAGFQLVSLEASYRGPRLVSFTYRGVAEA